MNDVSGSYTAAHQTANEADALPPPPPPNRWRRWMVGGPLLILAVAALLLGAWRYATEQAEAIAFSDQLRDMVPRVRIASVQPSAGTTVVSLPSTTSAFAAANLFARASGYIDKRLVDIGDNVKEGQLLVQIVAPELDHQIAQAEATLAQLNASVAQTQANYELARVTWQRDSPLVAQGWVTQQQGTVDQQTLKAQESALNVAKANVKAQEAQLRVLYQQKDYQRVVAPFDGVITQRNIDVGTLVQADATSGTFLFTIMQSHVIRAQVFVPQDQAFGLAPGVKAEVHVPEIPNRAFPGTVTRVAGALQPGTRTLLTEIDIPNPDNALQPGTYGTIELHIPRKVPSVSVPAAAIIFNRDGVQVAVIEDGVARLRKVNITRDLGKQVEVDRGVAAGDRVILNPSVALVDGSKVQTDPVTPANPATASN